MSFSMSFFARDVDAARARLQAAYAPSAVKALVELAIAGIPLQPPRHNVGGQTATEAIERSASSINGAGNRSTPAPPRLAGIFVQTHGHIDDHGGPSGVNLFRVEPFYD